MTRRADELVRELGLSPHPEGGHFREVIRSNRRVSTAHGERTAVTSIYFLLREGEWSRWHTVSGDELWHFYEGSPLELLQFDPEGQRLTRAVLGSPSTTAAPVELVPAGFWQAARPLGEYALVGCVVAPGFEFEDFALISDTPGPHPEFEGPLREYAHLL